MNVLTSNAPAGQNYELQSTNQGDLPVEVVSSSALGGGGLELLTSVHITGVTASIPLANLIDDVGLQPLLLAFSIQITVTTPADAGQVIVHMLAGTVHGSNASQAVEISAPDGVGNATLNTPANQECANRIFTTQAIDAGGVVQWSVDVVDVGTSVAYAVDVSIYKLAEF